MGTPAWDTLKAEDWDALHKLYLEGDEEAAERLLTLIHKTIPSIVYYVDSSLTRDEIAEISSRVFHKLHFDRALTQYRGPKSFMFWLRRVIRNARADYFRDQGKTRELFPASKDDPVVAEDGTTRESQMATRKASPDDQASRNQFIEALASCIDAQVEVDQIILRMKLLDGSSPDEIAETVGMKIDNVYVRLHRARQRLIECLKNKGFSSL